MPDSEVLGSSQKGVQLCSLDFGDWKQEKSGDFKVLFIFIFHCSSFVFYFPIVQELAYCGPDKENCIANQTMRDKSCLVPCDGIYAYITAHEKDEDVKSVTSSYLRYKMEYVKHLAFNSSADNFSKLI